MINEDFYLGPFDFRCLFLSMPRLQLFRRIDARAEEIMHRGLLKVYCSSRIIITRLSLLCPNSKEVASLVATRQLWTDTSAGKSVGYRQAIEYLQRVWAVPNDQQYRLQVSSLYRVADRLYGFLA